MESGYIKLYRSLLNWEWYDDVNTKVVFLHLLLTVSISDCKWHGIEIKRGSRVSSFSNLSEETKLTVKQIRTAISHLETTGEVARYKHAKFTVFAINNYDKYQLGASIAASNGQGEGKVAASNGQQYKKDKKDKKDKNTFFLSENQKEVLSTAPTLEEIKAYVDEIGGGVDAVRFYNIYTSLGWKTKKGAPITDWKMTVMHWKQTEGKYQRKPGPKGKDIPESPMADAYRSLIYNIDE